MKSTDPLDLSGRVAIVTGASRGIGEAAARGLAAAGARVTLASRKQGDLEAIAAEIRDAGGVALAYSVHTGDADRVEELVGATVEAFGRLDAVVNNAATNPHFGPLLSASESHWDKTFEVNVKGYAHLIRSAVPHLREAGGGKVVNVASVAARAPMVGLGVYSVTKAAVVMMTRVLAAELAADGIQVNAIAPGMIKTRFSSAMWSDPRILERVMPRIPGGRMGTPEDLVGAILYLVSPLSDYTTGQVLEIDAGLGLGAID
jgi:NAD(P)-dependent dehydrogenase (short-subunit alcohol dehydrogenase family)